MPNVPFQLDPNLNVVTYLRAAGSKPKAYIFSITRALFKAHGSADTATHACSLTPTLTAANGCADTSTDACPCARAFAPALARPVAAAYADTVVSAEFPAQPPPFD